jgi:hypothetical protein
MQEVWHPSKSTTIGGFLKALGAECHSLSLKGYQKVAGGRSEAQRRPPEHSQ